MNPALLAGVGKGRLSSLQATSLLIVAVICLTLRLFCPAHKWGLWDPSGHQGMDGWVRWQRIRAQAPPFPGQGWLHQQGGDDLLLPALQLGAGRPHGLRAQLPGEQFPAPRRLPPLQGPGEPHRPRPLETRPLLKAPPICRRRPIQRPRSAPKATPTHRGHAPRAPGETEFHLLLFAPTPKGHPEGPSQSLPPETIITSKFLPPQHNPSSVSDPGHLQAGPQVPR